MATSEEQEVCIARTGKRIPIVMQDRHGRSVGRATLEFTGGRLGAQEAGLYAFWTVVGRSGMAFTVRTSPGRSVENRLNEYSSLSAETIELLEKDAVAVVPAPCSEIRRWVNQKSGDAPFARWESLQCVEGDSDS